MTQETTKMPLLGDMFPSLKATTTHGELHLPEDMKGKRWILFSHPADFTPVCTTEFIAFQEKYETFKSLNCELIGLSVDQVFSHIKRIERIQEKMNVKITFPIIADTGNIAEQLGLIHPGKGTNTVRAVFIMDDTGKIRTILYYPQEVGRNIEEIVRIVEALQTSDKNKVAMPANWPNNTLLKNKVIIPPANTVEIAQTRKEQEKKGEIQCFDRRFCYKSL